jgi:hypothetical protein
VPILSLEKKELGFQERNYKTSFKKETKIVTSRKKLQEHHKKSCGLVPAKVQILSPALPLLSLEKKELGFVERNYIRK